MDEKGVLWRWESIDTKYRFVVVEVVFANVLTKALLPLRIMASLGLGHGSPACWEDTESTETYELIPEMRGFASRGKCKRSSSRSPR